MRICYSGALCWIRFIWFWWDVNAFGWNITYFNFGSCQHSRRANIYERIWELCVEHSWMMCIRQCKNMPFMTRRHCSATTDCSDYIHFYYYYLVSTRYGEIIPCGKQRSKAEYIASLIIFVFRCGIFVGRVYELMFIMKYLLLLSCERHFFRWWATEVVNACADLASTYFLWSSWNEVIK